jgi:hypothetical protein
VIDDASTPAAVVRTERSVATREPPASQTPRWTETLTGREAPSAATFSARIDAPLEYDDSVAVPPPSAACHDRSRAPVAVPVTS